MRYITIALITCITMGSCNPDITDDSWVYKVEEGCNERKYHVSVHYRDNNAVVCTDRKYELGEVLMSQPKWDLPEEWQALSTDSISADTLLGWRSSDGVVHISYYNQRNR